MAKNSSQSVEFVFSNLVTLETQLQSCMEYIPFIEHNEGVISPKFIPIIMDACGLIDSIFHNISGDQTKRYDLKRYCKLHEPSMLLEDNVSLFLAYPIKPLNPFENWTKAQPDWWAAYNSLKHDRLTNYQVATFTNAVMAICGLHQLMARCKAFVGPFLRAGWIDTNEDTIVTLGSAAHLGALHPQPPSLVIESRLFVSPTRENFVRSFDGLYFELDWDMPGISDRLRNLLSAHEDW